MTKKELEKANRCVNQSDELNRFVKTCRTCWNIIWLKHPKFKMITAYGAIRSELLVDEELAKRILITIENYVWELEDDFEKM